ncbi:MAG: divergent polysaccharide deacetylase family protein [Candidatus Omnitrophota bacterium]
MSKSFKIILFVLILASPLIFYKYFYKPRHGVSIRRFITKPIIDEKPKVALIFDDLGESLQDLKEINSLNVPVTISILPGLKLSKNIAHLSSGYGFSVLAHLPLEPKNAKKFETNKYRFISSSLTKSERAALLRYYLNYIRLAIGVNNHMGSQATENPELMREILIAVKGKGMVFIDSRTSKSSVACEVAKEVGVPCAYNEGFFDSLSDIRLMENRLKELLARAKLKGKIVIIAHPKKNTFSVLRKLLPETRKEVQFITIKEYFDP